MSVIIPDHYKQLRATVPFGSVSLGYGSIHLIPAVELEAAQQGYGVISEGGEKEWQDEWVVIGYEGLCGDPIFIDTSDGCFPVFTAIHGMDEWSPQLIASSFSHFVQILEQLLLLSVGRTDPIELEQHPISFQESEAFSEFITRGSLEAELDFWKGLLQS